MINNNNDNKNPKDKKPVCLPIPTFWDDLDIPRHKMQVTPSLVRKETGITLSYCQAGDIKNLNILSKNSSFSSLPLDMRS